MPDPDGLLDLPKGFRYRVLSREGDALRSGEGKVPSHCDGMAAFPGRAGGRGARTHLVRNHENRKDAAIRVPAVKGLTYDPMGMGGCTALALDSADRVQSERVAIAGTAVNCAGGPTPWHTWLTCEETEDKAGTNGYTKDHGFIFEVDPYDPRRTGAVPLTAMGRFQHEAIAVDPRSGVVYETEDAFEKPFGLFYRFLPREAPRRDRVAARGRKAPGPAGAGGGRPVHRPGAGDVLQRHRVGDRPRSARGGNPHPASRTSARAASPTPRSWRAATGAGRRSTSSPASPRARTARPPTTSVRSGATTRSGTGSPW